MESCFEADEKKKRQHKKQNNCALKMMMIKNHLVKGREYANHLEALLLLNNDNKNHNPFGDGDEELLALAQELVNKVVKSFNDSLCEVINSSSSSCGSTNGDEEVDEVVVVDHNNKPEVKERRGSYKRRRADDSWVTFSETTEDGYAWRKYGQKKILNTKHPRCYYRCTHKHDQQCRAMKQVQKIDTKDSTMFQTTYICQHTCKDTTKPSQLLASLPDPYVIDPLESKLISFQGQTQHVPPSSINEKLKDEESQSDDCKSSIDSSIWQDIVVASSSNSEPPVEFSCETGSYHHGKVASRTELEDLDIKTLTGFADFNSLDFSF